MRLSRPLRAVVLTWHITGAGSWFAFLAGQVWLPWFPFEGLLIVAASIAVPTGVLLAITSPLGLVRYWWMVAKLVGTLALLAAGTLAVYGHLVPYSRLAGVGVLWVLTWLSAARPWGKTRKHADPGHHSGEGRRRGSSHPHRA